jgi:transposase, IS5 family
LRGHTGLVLRDIRRQTHKAAEGRLRAQLLDRLDLVARLLRQTPKSTGKLYALHEPEVDCIAKGKARVRYEFGIKPNLNSAESQLIGIIQEVEKICALWCHALDVR